MTNKGISEVVNDLVGKAIEATLWGAVAGSLLLTGSHCYDVLKHRPRVNNYAQELDERRVAPADSPETYAVVVGNMHGNGEVFARWIENQGISENNTYILRNGGSILERDGHLTPENIDATFKHLKDKVDDNDTVIFYAAAHGSVEARPSGTSHKMDIPERKLSSDQIEDYFSNMKEGQGMIMLQSCYAATAENDLNSLSNIDRVYASRSHEPSWTLPGPRIASVTQSVARAYYNLENDSDGDGKLSLEDAVDAVRQDYAKTDGGGFYSGTLYDTVPQYRGPGTLEFSMQE